MLQAYEIFEIEKNNPKFCKNPEEKGLIESWEEELKIAQDMGLHVQAKRISTEITTLKANRLISTPPMTEIEIVIWQSWLPKAYYTGGDLSGYNFDRIPRPVLKAWEKAKKSNLFERFEIWTPEYNDPDPALVGVAGNNKYLLARWAESDAEFISFEQIKRELTRRWFANERISSGENSSRGFLVDSGYPHKHPVEKSSLLLASIVFLLPLGSPSFGTNITSVVTMFISSVVIGIVAWYFISRIGLAQMNKIAAKSPLLRAIAKHDQIQIKKEE